MHVGFGRQDFGFGQGLPCGLLVLGKGMLEANINQLRLQARSGNRILGKMYDVSCCTPLRAESYKGLPF